MNWMFDVLQLHQALVREARPSGAEQTGIAKVLKEMAAPYVDEIRSDAMGNLICHKKGRGKTVMLCAHMDAIGFMVTGADGHGGLSITNIGGFDPADLINTRPVPQRHPGHHQGQRGRQDPVRRLDLRQNDRPVRGHRCHL